jgi:hypothetical protein
MDSTIPPQDKIVPLAQLEPLSVNQLLQSNNVLMDTMLLQLPDLMSLVPLAQLPEMLSLVTMLPMLCLVKPDSAQSMDHVPLAQVMLNHVLEI